MKTNSSKYLLNTEQATIDHNSSHSSFKQVVQLIKNKPKAKA